jgi:hypothetical protein
MANNTAQLIAASSGPSSQLRTGTIAQATDNSATVVVGGTSFQASFLSPYEPLPGHLVAVLRQDSSWLILGRIAGSGANLITEGSFEGSVNGGPPVGWIQFDITSVSTAVVIDSPLAVDGTKVLSVTGSGIASDCYVYSSPVPVTAGQQFNLSVYAGAQQGPDSPVSVTASLYALWFANETNLYPTTSSADTLVASAVNVATAPPFTPLSGTVTAPVSGAMRLALRSATNSTTGIIWDFAVVREVV